MKEYTVIKEPTVIIIAGATAVGKTAAAIRLAQDLSTKIISADSRQCFKELNIGVAKPSPEELLAVHHYFINSHSILGRTKVPSSITEQSEGYDREGARARSSDEGLQTLDISGKRITFPEGSVFRNEEVTAALFEELALQWTADIFRDQVAGSRQPVAVMVGGTGLYIKAYTEGLDTIPPIDPAIRQQVLHQYEEAGIDWLQQQIKDADPEFFKTGEMQNPRRLMRALEVKRSTGHSILTFRTREKKQRPFRIVTIGLSLPKDTLHTRINQRVDKMMEQGLLEEVKTLFPYRDLNALQTVGYTELFDHLEGRVSLDEAVENIKVNTRRYAKRQMTWFRKDPSLKWVDAEEGLSKDNLHLILT